MQTWGGAIFLIESSYHLLDAVWQFSKVNDWRKNDAKQTDLRFCALTSQQHIVSNSWASVR